MSERFSSFLRKNISDRLLLAGGLLIIPSFLLLENPVFKSAHLVLFLLLVLLCGKTVRIFPSLVIFTSIVIVNLFRPYGELFFSVFGLRITRGALESGVNKGATLIGLIYCSKFFVRPTLSLPGTLGALLGKTFFYFEQITERWKTVEGGSVIGKLDALLLTLTEDDSKGKKAAMNTKIFTIYGLLFLALLTIIHWCSFLLSLRLPG